MKKLSIKPFARKARVACILLAIAAMASSCSHKPQGWGVDVSLQGAPADAALALYRYTDMGWALIDSLHTSADGSCSYRAEAGLPNPDVMRLDYDGRHIYFPIDSIETITITARADNFDRSYTLSGSGSAIAMHTADSIIAQAVDREGPEMARSSRELKLALAPIILNDTVGNVAYYLINKQVGGQPLFSEANRADAGIIGGVATMYARLRPADPRTEHLRRRALSARRGNIEMEANEIGYIDLELPDATGTMRRLSECASLPGVTLLSFTAYAADWAPAYNQAIEAARQKYADAGVNVYQVSVDDDEALWLQACNLPWTAVRATGSKLQYALQSYLVDAIPATFVIANGEIVERLASPAEIDAAIARAIK